MTPRGAMAILWRLTVGGAAIGRSLAKMFRAAAWFLILLMAMACGGEPDEPAARGGESAQPAARAATPHPTATATAVPTAAATVTPAPTATPTVTPTPTFAPSAFILPTVAPARAPTVGTPVSVERRLDRIAYRTEAIRGLRARGDIERRLVSSDEMRAVLAADLAEDADEVARAQRLYALLGIIPPHMDLGEALAGAFGDVALGAFDWDANTIYVTANDGERLTPQNELTAAHEFTHALQQTHFDIAGLRDALAGNSDRAAALRALAEGDATLTDDLYYFNVFDESQQDAADAESAAADMSAFIAAPTFIRRTVAFPYVEGRRFAVILFLRNDDFSAVDAAYSALPSSTEQIIHPEKYGLEEPIEVEIAGLADALGAGWTELERDVMGELFFRSMLESQIGTAQMAGEAAAGWGGDGYALLAGPDSATALASESVWDTVEDTVDMGIALRSYFLLATGATRWLDISESGAASETFLLKSDGGTAAELRVDAAAKRIRLIVASSEDALLAAAEALGAD